MNHVDPMFVTCQSRAGPLAINPNRSSNRGGGVKVEVVGVTVGSGSDAVLVGLAIGLEVDRVAITAVGEEDRGSSIAA